MCQKESAFSIGNKSQMFSGAYGSRLLYYSILAFWHPPLPPFLLKKKKLIMTQKQFLKFERIFIGKGEFAQRKFQITILIAKTRNILVRYSKPRKFQHRIEYCLLEISMSLNRFHLTALCHTFHITYHLLDMSY